MPALVFWHWWVLAAGLIALEALVPGAVILWFGIAAALTGLVLLLAPALSLDGQLLFFAAASVVGLLVGRRFMVRMRVEESDRPSLNRRAEQLIGKTATLDQPIADGHGTIRLYDSRWRVQGPDLPAGTRVRVAAVDGSTLEVEPAEADAKPSAAPRAT